VSAHFPHFWTVSLFHRKMGNFCILPFIHLLTTTLAPSPHYYLSFFSITISHQKATASHHHPHPHDSMTMTLSTGSHFSTLVHNIHPHFIVSTHVRSPLLPPHNTIQPFSTKNYNPLHYLLRHITLYYIDGYNESWGYDITVPEKCGTKRHHAK